MVIANSKIVTFDRVIEKGFIVIEDGKIASIGEGAYNGNDNEVVDANGQIAFPGFIDIHIHGSKNIDFMDADAKEIKTIADSLYPEGVTTFLATTLTSDHESLLKVCRNVAKAKENVPSLGGIHLEGPYISAKYKGAQNEAFIREPNSKELDEYIKESNGNIRYITMAPETSGAMDFISHAVAKGVTVSAGHSDASFDDVAEAIKHGLTNTTHTHNAMSGHHHRKPGIVTAAMYFDCLYTEMICDGIHVCPNTIKTWFKLVGADRFIIVTDALKAKHSDVEEFELFGLPCIRKDGAAYLTSGPLAGSLLSMDQGIRNVREYTGASLVELAKISSTNAAKAIHLDDRGELKAGKIADVVLMDENLHVSSVYKLGKKVI